jgi:hypothetical protein
MSTAAQQDRPTATVNKGPKSATTKGSTKAAAAPKAPKAERIPAVNKDEVKVVAGKLRDGSSSIMREAARLGCYHQTLRVTLRKHLGAEKYDELIGASKAKRSAIKAKAKAARQKEQASTKAAAKAAKKAAAAVTESTEQVEAEQVEAEQVEAEQAETQTPAIVETAEQTVGASAE